MKAHPSQMLLGLNDKQALRFLAQVGFDMLTSALIVSHFDKRLLDMSDDFGATQALATHRKFVRAGFCALLTCAVGCASPAALASTACPARTPQCT